MANHYTADEVAPNTYERRLHKSVQHPTPEMLAGVPQWPHPAQYCAKVDGVFVALADDALVAWTAQQEAAAFIKLVTAHALDIAELARLLAVFEIAMPVTQQEVKEAIYAKRSSDPAMAFDAMKLQDDYARLKSQLTDEQMVEIGQYLLAQGA